MTLAKNQNQESRKRMLLHQLGVCSLVPLWNQGSRYSTGISIGNMTEVDASHHDAHYNAPEAGCFRHLVRKLSSGGASLYDTPRPRLYSGDARNEGDDIDALSREHHKRLRDRALQRRKALLEAQARANKLVKRELQKQNVRKVVSSLKCSLDRINPTKWKDNSEHDQKVAAELEKEFEDALEQEQYLKLCREASDRCLQAIKDHHQHFLEDHPNGTYEQWIRELHPDNTCAFRQRVAIDHRFYLSDSDHRNLWNEHLGDGARAHVPARHLSEKTSSDGSEWSTST